jgi:hypothetical protein
MALATPWNARSAGVLLWQLSQAVDCTVVWPATDSNGVLLILKPPVTKADAAEPWHPLAVQDAPAIGM